MPLKPGSPAPASRGGRPQPTNHFKTPYRLQVLTDRGWESEAWVHCPLCRARSAGFNGRGEPAYTGGFVVCATARHRRGVLVACECWLGRRLAEAQGLMRYDELRIDDRVVRYPQPSGRVVNGHGQVCTRGPVEEPDQLAPGYQAQPPAREEPPADLFGA